MRAILLALVLAVLPGAAAAQTTLSAGPVADTLLVRLLNDAVEIEIADAEGSPNLIPRLYAISDEGSCVEDTHMICSHHYFLAVSEDGEAPEQAVFSLGEVGEITGARVRVDRGIDRPRLEVRVMNYPRSAFHYQPDLVREERAWSIDLGLAALRITAEP